MLIHNCAFTYGLEDHHISVQSLKFSLDKVITNTLLPNVTKLDVPYFTQGNASFKKHTLYLPYLRLCILLFQARSLAP